MIPEFANQATGRARRARLECDSFSVGVARNVVRIAEQRLAGSVLRRIFETRVAPNRRHGLGMNRILSRQC